jgi:hypothetical protein
MDLLKSLILLKAGCTKDTRLPHTILECILILSLELDGSSSTRNAQFSMLNFKTIVPSTKPIGFADTFLVEFEIDSILI